MIIIKLQGGKGGGEMIGKRLKKIRENRKIEIARSFETTPNYLLGFDEIEFEEKKKKEEIYKERALVKDREEKMEFF